MEAGDFEVLTEGGGDEKGIFGFEFSQFGKFSVDFDRLCREVLGGVAIVGISEGRKKKKEEEVGLTKRGFTSFFVGFGFFLADLGKCERRKDKKEK